MTGETAATEGGGLSSVAVHTPENDYIDGHPAFGPDRPRAAIRAIAELQAAREALVSIEWCFTPPVIERHRRAVQIRDMYPEYADDFRGH